MEYRMRCQVCGKIYCFSDDDVSNNKTNAAMAAVSAVGALASVFSGTRLDTYALNSQSDRYSSKVVDYRKCPFCNSTSVEPLSEDAWEVIQKQDSEELRKQVIQVKRADINSNATTASLQRRVQLFLEDKDWDSAAAYCEQILDIEPECAMAYVYKLMIDLKVSAQDELAQLAQPFVQEKNYQMALRFADDELKKILQGYNRSIVERNNQEEYDANMSLYKAAESAVDYKKLSESFKKLGNYRNSAEMSIQCAYKHAMCLYQKASTAEDYLNAKSCFDSLGDYENSKTLSDTCRTKSEEAYKKAVYDRAIKKISSNEISTIESGIEDLKSISNWLDSDQKIINAQNKIITISNQKTKKKRGMIVATVGIIIAVIVIAVAILFINSINNNNKYNNAQKLYEECKFTESFRIWNMLDNYKDSIDRKNDAAEKASEQLIQIISQHGYDDVVNDIHLIETCLSEEQKANIYFAVSVSYAQRGMYKEALNSIDLASRHKSYGDMKSFCVAAIEIGDIDKAFDQEEHNMKEICASINRVDSFIDVQNLYNYDVMKKLRGLNGTWKASQVTKDGKEKYASAEYYYDILDGNAKYYEKTIDHGDYDIYYFEGSFYIGEPGRWCKYTTNRNGQVSSYDGERDKEFVHTYIFSDGSSCLEVSYKRIR